MENAVMKAEAPQGQMVPINDATALMTAIAQAARDPNVDVDKMERLFAMHERMELRQAEVAFNDAMKEAQSQIRRVATDKTNSQTHSNYATYAALDRAIRPVYTGCGFALSFDTEDGATPELLRVVCHVSHEAGFTRRYRVDMPSDGKGAKGGDVMTKTHATGSAMSYGQRYLLKLIFNVAIGNDPDDDDGNKADSNQDQQWLDAIAACSDETELAGRKHELVKACGGVDKVPAMLRSACVQRRAELKAIK